MIKILELLAFSVSAVAFFSGVFSPGQKNMPKYFKLYICASACYMLEELWVVVNSLLGNGSQDGLITVRLFGFFGCLCFMLSANADEFDRLVDEGNDRRARLLAFAAPLVLIAIYSVYVFSGVYIQTAVQKIIGFAVLSPALFASYFSLKHLLLPEDEMGFLKAAKVVDVLSLVFYGANYLYPLINMYCSRMLMGLYDSALAVMMLLIVFMCRKGAEKWKALI